MAENDRITLIVEGLPEDGGRVRFAAFLSQLQSLSATINKLDRDANQGKQASYFRIAELSYDSPARVVLEAQSLARQPYTGHLIVESFGRVADAITAGEDLSGIDADLLEVIRGIARPVGTKVKSATLVVNDHRLDLTENAARHVDNALAIDEECEGSIEGMLEQINIHLGANTFHIYPEIGPRKVTCKFPAKRYDDAVSAVGKRVEVFGTLHYRTGAVFPHQIAVTEIEAFPPESELPDWDDLRGRAPDATNGHPTEVFVREMRDGWR